MKALCINVYKYSYKYCKNMLKLLKNYTVYKDVHHHAGTSSVVYINTHGQQQQAEQQQQKE